MKRKKKKYLSREQKVELAKMVISGLRTTKDAAKYFGLSYTCALKHVKTYKNSKAFKNPKQSWSLSSLDNRGLRRIL